MGDVAGKYGHRDGKKLSKLIKNLQAQGARKESIRVSCIEISRYWHSRKVAE